MPTTQQELQICATRRGDCRKKQTRDAVAATSCSSTAVGACVLDVSHTCITRPPPAPRRHGLPPLLACVVCLTRDLSQECMTVTLLKGFSLNVSSGLLPAPPRHCLLLPPRFRRSKTCIRLAQPTPTTTGSRRVSCRSLPSIASYSSSLRAKSLGRRGSTWMCRGGTV